MARTRILAALALSVVGGFLSLVLISTHYGIPLMGEAVLAACGAGGGCDIVSQSRYAQVFGVPLAAVGLFFYGSLLALLAPALFGSREEADDGAVSLGFYLAALAVFIDVILFGLQAITIKAFCKFCIATYFVNGFLVALLWPFRRPTAAMSFLGSSKARQGLAAWLVGTAFAGAAALSINATLLDRKALASSSILGLPSAAETSSGVSTGSAEEQLALAQAEAKKWKETLDDERRLQIYLTDKAKSDFNNSEVAKIDLSRAPVQGGQAAPISAVAYSDFMCPFCRELALGLRNYLPVSGNRVKFHFKHFPLDMACNPQIGRTVHPGACELALGGVCADENGRFWEYHDKVYARAWDRANREDVLSLGSAVGLDRSRMSACLDQAATRGRLAKDIEEGSRFGVASTPTMFVNGRKLKSVNVFLMAVEEERKRLNLPPLSASNPPPAQK